MLHCDDIFPASRPGLEPACLGVTDHHANLTFESEALFEPLVLCCLQNTEGSKKGSWSA